MTLTWWQQIVRKVIGFEIITRLRYIREGQKDLIMKMTEALDIAVASNRKLDDVLAAIANTGSVGQALLDSNAALTAQVADLLAAAQQAPATSPVVSDELAAALNASMAKATEAATAAANVLSLLQTAAAAPATTDVPEDPAPPGAPVAP